MSLFTIYRDGNPNVWITEVYGEAKAKEVCRILNNNFNLDAFFIEPSDRNASTLPIEVQRAHEVNERCDEEGEREPHERT